ncbi:GLPGLI family protein [uncultured Lacinutrix sp.]|uniref:GLPGLI family protein n=1 Tax=uncultured Lacinutrix sp. TaxID=574032 RepID=UPI00261312F9|nr:GLPGLI family protein [uncultured Lacinutrix sp.]
MKNIITIITILLLSNSTYCQNGVITYIITPTVDLSNEKRADIHDELELMSFQLVYNKEKSFFKKNKNVPIKKLASIMASIASGSKEEIHQLVNDKKTIYISEISSKVYRVVDTSKMNNWKLTNESKIIENYECYKATLTLFNTRSQKDYIIEAWYTPQIPVPFGPIGYGGLPGLILELKNRNGFVYTPESIKLNLKKIKIPKLENAEEISIKEKLILRKKERKVTKD